MMLLRKARAGDTAALLDIWERSVRATHRFLTEDDIAFYHPLVKQGLEALECWLTEAEGGVAGFMLLNGPRVEALFVDPAHMGKKIGTRLLSKARELAGPGVALRVDVNEQNPDALRFYLARGFKQEGRSEIDTAGRPFPLLHLRLEAEDHC